MRPADGPGPGGTDGLLDNVDRAVKLFVALVLTTLCVIASAAYGRFAATCEMPGEWAHTRDAAWLASALTRAGFESFGCTGSAFVVDLGGPAFTGQIHVWATRAPRGAGRYTTQTRLAGVVVSYGRVRGV
jgi:hypothetical protein